MMADLKEGRAHMIRPKYQLPTDASETPQNVGPDVAAESERSEEQFLNFGRYPPPESLYRRTARVQPNEQS
ncbi:MAG: hypothetical protein IPQ13_13825 [Holophagaceae bacterium]|nr:hypothetical protein [Holophagaceae bacterium]